MMIKLLLQFIFGFITIAGLIGFVVSPFMELEKGSKVGMISFIVALVGIVGIIFTLKM